MHPKGTEKSASNIDVGIIAGTLLVYTTPCFEALTYRFRFFSLLKT